MLHRKFKVVRTINSLENIDAFLNDGKDLKSLSICQTENDTIMSIGYDDETTVSHQYHLVVSKIGSPTATAEIIQQEVEKAAHDINGIICQDLAIIGGELFVTFLTVKG